MTTPRASTPMRRRRSPTRRAGMVMVRAMITNGAAEPAPDREADEEAHTQREDDRAAGGYAPQRRDEQPGEPGDRGQHDAPDQIAARASREVARGRRRHDDHGLD